MGYRGLQLASVWAQPAGTNVVHPGAAAFSGASRLVKIKLPNELAFAFNAVKIDTGLPDRRAVFAQLDFEQGFDNAEQTSQHFRCSEVLFDFLLTECIAFFLELFANVGIVPRLRIGKSQRAGGKSAKVGNILLGERPGASGKITQESYNFIG